LTALFGHQPTCKNLRGNTASEVQYIKTVLGALSRCFHPKTEAVDHEVETHFGSSLPANFAETVLGALSRFLRPKIKLFVVKFRRFLEVFALRGS